MSALGESSVHRRGLMHLAMLAAVTIWSAAIIAVKVALQAIGPIALAAVRVAAAALLFGLWLAFRRPRPNFRLSPRQWLYFAVMAFAGVALDQIFFIGGIARASVAANALIVALVPVAVLIMAAGLGLETVTPLKVVGILTALAGVFVLTFNFASRRLAPTWKGDLFQLAGTVVFAVYTILVKKVAQEFDPVTLNALCFILGAVFLLPFAAPALAATHWSAFTPAALEGLVFLVVFASVISYWLFAYALQGLSASRVAAFSYLQPLLAIAMGAVMLSEKLSLRIVAGGGLILLGLYLTEHLSGSERDSTTAV